MPFVEENINEIIEHKRNTDPKFRKAWDESREEYKTIAEEVAARKKHKSDNIDQEVNPAVCAMQEFQNQMKGEAEKAGLLSDEDVAAWITESRREENKK